ncbi:tyrosine-type recombinase/integrase [Nostoc sp.]|uniref:tyrosine-type recombinase/integrase n=1 Tax=Nostoc sp. TaxID=1180 RepID=UPI002FF588CE
MLIGFSTIRAEFKFERYDWFIKGVSELEGIRFHDLRHTFGTKRVGLMGIDELRALMGHETIQMTLRYSKVTSRRAEKIAQRVFEKIPNYGQ